MRNAHTTLPFSASLRPQPHGGAIEWEELPSFADSLRGRLNVLGAPQRDPRREPLSTGASVESVAAPVPVWDNTRPAPFETTAQSAPFREPLEGLAIREVTEPDVFRHFFGVSRAVD